MPPWFSSFVKLVVSQVLKLKGIQAWLAEKILKYGGKALLDAWEKYQREQKQKEAEKKVEEDVQNKTPRSEETKKREEDWMNS